MKMLSALFLLEHPVLLMHSGTVGLLLIDRAIKSLRCLNWA